MSTPGWQSTFAWAPLCKAAVRELESVRKRGPTEAEARREKAERDAEKRRRAHDAGFVTDAAVRR